MAQKSVSDEDFIAAFKRLGSPEAVSKETGLGIRAVYRKRKFLLEKHGVELESFAAHQNNKKIMTIIPDDRRVISSIVENGMVFIASDCHYWPGQATTAHRAFVELLKEYKGQTAICVLNGDVFDGAQVSRHPPLMGTVTPTPKQEIEACQDRLHEIADASKNSRKFWTFGNHDTRLFSRLAANSPELVEMVSLFDHFPGWQTCWRVDINDDTVIKHRWHNGIHATYNNALKSGKTLITGHLHKLQSVGYSDYNGRRWGVDTGTLAEPYGDQFTYTECNPVNWASGFVVLTYKDGVLLPPELCEVLNGVAYFRGQEVCRAL